MRIESIVSNLSSWLSSTELFARPNKQIPGKWELYEYYTEPGEELIHYPENQLKKENLYWTIEFFESEQLFQKTNIELPFQNESEKLVWNRSGMYIILVDPIISGSELEFRFSVDKGVLKLLKKDAFGKIEFFGFFKKIGV